MRRHALAIATVSLLILAPALGVPALADDLTKAEQQQRQIQGDLGNLQGQLNTVLTQKQRTQAQLDSLSGQIGGAEQRLANENTKLDQLNGQVAANLLELAAKKADQEREQDLLNRRTRALYKEGGGGSMVDTLFSAANFSELLDRFLVMRDITHANQVLLAQVGADRAAIEELGRSLQQAHDDQKSIVDSIAQQTAALNSQYSQASALRSTLAAQQDSIQQRQAEAKRSLAQVNSEIAALQAARRNAHSSGIFAWPGVQGPITQDFGCSPYAYEPPPPAGYSCPSIRPYFHTGIDIGGPWGSEIDAGDGGIAYTYVSSYGYGLHVIIVHANGLESVYGHMSSFAITSGQSVAKGQKIGAEGSTGNSTGAHLHFEIRLNNTPQDPCHYVGC